MKRTWLNDSSNEENGFFRLTQCCGRCAYISIDEGMPDRESTSNTCQRFNNDINEIEAVNFVCDCFC